MSFAIAINAAIAVAEGRTDDAKRILRDPSVRDEIGSIHRVVGRLYTALDQYAGQKTGAVLHEILQTSLRLEPPEEGDALLRAAYLEGVAAVELLIENSIGLSGGD